MSEIERKATEIFKDASNSFFYKAGCPPEHMQVKHELIVQLEELLRNKGVIDE